MNSSEKGNDSILKERVCKPNDQISRPAKKQKVNVQFEEPNDNNDNGNENRSTLNTTYLTSPKRSATAATEKSQELKELKQSEQPQQSTQSKPQQPVSRPKSRSFIEIHSQKGHPVSRGSHASSSFPSNPIQPPPSSSSSLPTTATTSSYPSSIHPNPNQRVIDLQHSLSQLKGPISIIVDYLNFSYASAVRQFAGSRQTQLIKTNDTRVIQKCADEIGVLLDNIMTTTKTNTTTWLPGTENRSEKGDKKSQKAENSNNRGNDSGSSNANTSSNSNSSTGVVENLHGDKMLSAAQILKTGTAVELLNEYRRKMKQVPTKKKKKVNESVPSRPIESADYFNPNSKSASDANSNFNSKSDSNSNPKSTHKSKPSSYHYQYGMPIPPYSSLYTLTESGEYLPIVPELPNKSEIVNLNTPQTYIVGQEIPPLSDLLDLLESKMDLAIELAAARQEVYNYNVWFHSQQLQQNGEKEKQ